MLFQMMEIAFKLIRGHRLDGCLLWATEEKHLYSKKCGRGGSVEYECYQTTLRKRKNTKREHKACTSGVVLKNGKCFPKKKGHTSHENHQKIFEDLQTLNKVKEVCIIMKENCEDLCISVPARNIFTRELSKLVT